MYCPCFRDLNFSDSTNMDKKKSPLLVASNHLIDLSHLCLAGFGGNLFLAQALGVSNSAQFMRRLRMVLSISRISTNIPNYLFPGMEFRIFKLDSMMPHYSINSRRILCIYQYFANPQPCDM